MERIISFIPQKPVMLFDIFINDRFYGQVSFKCLPGFEYKYKELKKRAVETRPSLQHKDFELMPTENKVI